jgi:hypothetical protein
VVERFHNRRHFKHWKRHGYRPVTVYYLDGRYYDRYDRHHPRLHRIIVYERGGRYYRWDDRDYNHRDHWRDDRYHRDRYDHDRYDDDRDDRYRNPRDRYRER